MDPDHAKRIALAAARRGGSVLKNLLGGVSIRKKGAIDLVTEADIQSEKAILDTIRSAFPHHAVLAEESGLNRNEADSGEYRWIIDPLDGTTNFAHGLPLFSVSIALEIRSKIVLGIVLNPVTGELFTAMKGRGAECNGIPIRVSDTAEVSESLLVTGFPYNFKEILHPVLNRFSACLKASQGVRRLGSAALDLCFVACGRFDGFWEQNLKPWDTAAGLLIAGEAGAEITDFSGGPFTVDRPEILASNGHIHKELMTLLNDKEQAADAG